MALSKRAKEAIRRAVTDDRAARELTAALEAEMAVGVAAAVDDLDASISDPPEQAEVQEIADKVDELMAAMRDAGLMEE